MSKYSEMEIHKKIYETLFEIKENIYTALLFFQVIVMKGLYIIALFVLFACKNNHLKYSK